MTGLEALSVGSRVLLYVLMTLIGFLAVLVAWAQFRIIRGHPFQNPDGSSDADLTVACPLAFVGLALVFVNLKLGLVALFGVSVWMLWANVMTTVTSLRFERPKITASWLIVFPFGSVVGMAYLTWFLLHFERVFG
jgi:hypothetical protein